MYNSFVYAEEQMNVDASQGEGEQEENGKGNGKGSTPRQKKVPRPCHLCGCVCVSVLATFKVNFHCEATQAIRMVAHTIHHISYNTYHYI